MDIELQKQLKDKYPLLFVDLMNENTTVYNSCLAFGIETNNGWFNLLDEACSKIEPLIAEWIKNATQEQLEWGHPKVEQIKEKFGTLRFYISQGSPEMYEAINEAEEKSAVTCETCGQPGKLNNESWCFVSCDNCKKGY